MLVLYRVTKSILEIEERDGVHLFFIFHRNRQFTKKKLLTIIFVQRERNKIENITNYTILN